MASIWNISSTTICVQAAKRVMSAANVPLPELEPHPHHDRQKRKKPYFRDHCSEDRPLALEDVEDEVDVVAHLLRGRRMPIRGRGARCPRHEIAGEATV